MTQAKTRNASFSRRFCPSRASLFLTSPRSSSSTLGMSILTGHTSFQEMFAALHIGSYISYALAILGTFVLMMIAMVENSRMPIDDPKTHLELTMVHEVMILDNSGFDLGLILTAGYLKFAMYGALIANFFMGSFPLYLTIPIFL